MPDELLSSSSYEYETRWNNFHLILNRCPLRLSIIALRSYCGYCHYVSSSDNRDFVRTPYASKSFTLLNKTLVAPWFKTPKSGTGFTLHCRSRSKRRAFGFSFSQHMSRGSSNGPMLFVLLRWVSYFSYVTGILRNGYECWIQRKEWSALQHYYPDLNCAPGLVKNVQ